MVKPSAQTREASQSLFAGGLPFRSLKGIQLLLRSIAVTPLHMSRQITRPRLPLQVRFAKTHAIKSRGILLDPIATRTCVTYRITCSSVVGTARLLPEDTTVPGLNRLAYSIHGNRLPSRKDFRPAVQALCQLRYKKIESPTCTYGPGNSIETRDPVNWSTNFLLI